VIKVYESAIARDSKSHVANTCKIVQLHRNTVRKIVNRGSKTPDKAGRKDARFKNIDDFTKEVIKRTMYASFNDRIVPILYSTFVKVKARLDFPYKFTHFRKVVNEFGFRYCALDSRISTMRGPRLRELKTKYIKRFSTFREARKVMVNSEEQKS